MLRLRGVTPRRPVAAFATLLLALLGAEARSDPLLFTETELLVSDPSPNSLFGTSTAVSGDAAVVGADSHDLAGLDAGAAYVFGRDTGGVGNWGEVIRLISGDAAAGDRFGSSVGIDVDTVVVGAVSHDFVVSGSNTGAAYVFERNAGGPDGWGEVRELIASNPAVSDEFGDAVAISGDTIVVGAPRHEFLAIPGARTGVAFVFERNAGGAGNWGLVMELAGSDVAVDDRFGSAVAISAGTIVVGAPRHDGDGLDSGAAYVFDRNAGGANAWGEVAKLTFFLDQQGAQLGRAVAISGDTVVVGEPLRDVQASNAGLAHVFERNLGGANAWGLAVTFGAFGPLSVGNGLGWSVAISGDLVAVGAPTDDAATNQAGALYMFSRDEGGPGAWGQVARLLAASAATNDNLGRAVALNADTVVGGAPFHMGNAGTASVFSDPIAFPFICGDSILTPPEVCDDGNLIDGDGCSSNCLPEDSLELVGIAEGGTVQLEVDGVPIVLATTAGQTASEAAAALAALINADPTLSALGISALSIANRLVVAGGTISNVLITDPGFLSCTAGGGLGDFDCDGLADFEDSCPTVPDVGDGDGDGVDDACDTCPLHPNPPVPAGQVAPWMTLVSGQRDDEADGIGNRCDFLYGNPNVLISPLSVSDMRVSVFKPVSGTNCGVPGTKICGEFDHDEVGSVIGPGDVSALRQRVFTLNGPSCGSACDPFEVPGFSGPIGSANEILGKAICEGPEC